MNVGDASVAYGDSSVVKPAPLTVLLAASVVNEPVLPLIGALLIVPPEIVGVLIVGDVPKTAEPLPVSSEMTPASCAEVVEANCARVPLVSANDVPHVQPDPPVLYCSALLDAEQLGIANAVGDALVPVTFASTVLAA
ncbi:hypothetical protein [Paraburkholderia caledonica]|uniref:Secreted protein n=1 Tax=Paraburkholderia caledonica TaxID=134536 RepID=A0AB73INV4_9BURK|nr:hypothetical protein [Paraburkholderia caledonica]